MLVWPDKEVGPKGADGKSDECYLLQGNVDDYVSLDIKQNSRVVAIPDIKILNRHNVWGREESGYTGSAWRFVLSLTLFLHLVIAIFLVKWLFSVA